MSAANFDATNNYDVVPREDRIAVFGYNAEANNINIKENANEKAVSFSHLKKGYFKDTQDTGLEHFTEKQMFQTEEVEVYALL